jgi:anti-sigma-K factor RskA
MTCDDLRPDYFPYALGSLGDPERSEIKAHLQRGCENCTAGMREARTLAFALAAGIEGPDPPKELRGRVLAAAGGRSEKRSSFFNVWAATAMAAALITAVATGFFVYQRSLREQLAQMQTLVEHSSAQAASVREVIDFLQAPETREVVFGEGQPTPPRGRVFFQRSGVLLIASHLPPPPPDRTYEMWIIRAGKPTPAGLFISDAQGTAIHMYRPIPPPESTDIVAVTLERAGGATLPTSTPVIAAPL